MEVWKVVGQRLKSLKLRNFKRFRSLNVALEDANILVGPNNAGKSSVLDCLRILFGARRYAIRIRPQIINTDEGEQYGYEIPTSSMLINVSRLSRNLTDEDTEIEYVHENGTHLKILFSATKATRLWIVGAGTRQYSGKSYFEIFPVDIVIVPMLSPFEEVEYYNTDEVVERERATRLSSRHFRNVWIRDTESFAEFKALVESTWPNVTIERPSRTGVGKVPLEMFFLEGRYPREVSWSGFGLQVWMQILTHLMRGASESIFVLDEPDVYLHPDMQRKLLHLISERFSQYFLATHSTEIINDAESGDIIMINPDRASARRIRTDADYNGVYAYIGSLNNRTGQALSRKKGDFL